MKDTAAQGRSIRLFLVDGTSNCLLTAATMTRMDYWLSPQPDRVSGALACAAAAGR